MIVTVVIIVNVWPILGIKLVVKIVTKNKMTNRDPRKDIIQINPIKNPETTIIIQ